NADVLPRDVALRYLALPAVVERDKILLVLANPSDMKVLDELRFVSGKRLLPHIGLGVLLEETIQRLYSARQTGGVNLVFGVDADPSLTEDGHIEIVTGASPLEPPHPASSIPMLPNEPVLSEPPAAAAPPGAPPATHTWAEEPTPARGVPSLERTDA